MEPEKMMQLIMMPWIQSFDSKAREERNENMIFYVNNKQVRSLICFQIKKKSGVKRKLETKAKWRMFFEHDDVDVEKESPRSTFLMLLHETQQSGLLRA